MKPDADGFLCSLISNTLCRTELTGWKPLEDKTAKVVYLTFANSLLDLLNLNLAEAFDLEQGLPCGGVDGLMALAGLNTSLDWINENGDSLQQRCSSHWP